jgi:hypothetical protein
VAAIARPGVCENRDLPMSKKLSAAATSVASGKVHAPIRVKLKRVDCDHAIPYPPDGQAREWWQRLMTAFGTTSSAFVQASLHQLIAAARLPNSGISEIAVNASLALIEGAKPQGEVEGALVLQMACTHAAAMAVLGRLGGGHGTDRTIAAKASAVSRLLRAYTAQVEALRHRALIALPSCSIRRPRRTTPSSCVRSRPFRRRSRWRSRQLPSALKPISNRLWPK